MGVRKVALVFAKVWCWLFFQKENQTETMSGSLKGDYHDRHDEKFTPDYKNTSYIWPHLITGYRGVICQLVNKVCSCFVNLQLASLHPDSGGMVLVVAYGSHLQLEWSLWSLWPHWLLTPDVQWKGFCVEFIPIMHVCQLVSHPKRISGASWVIICLWAEKRKNSLQVL